MPLLAREELTALTEPRPGPFVSIFMPTQRAAPETRQNPVDLKNLLREAEEKLAAMGLRTLQIEEIMAPAWALDQNSSAWERPGDGLAVFVAPGFYREYHLPIPMEQFVVVGNRFHLKPLLPALTNGGSFYVLALSQKDVRLFLGTPLTIAEVDLEDVPKSVAEALRYDNPEKQIQFHPSAPTRGIGRQGAMFHGHAEIADDAKDDIRLYFRQVNDGIHQLLKGQRVPLVLAGVEFLLPLYREMNTYPNLTKEGIEGNPELCTARELHQRAWKIIRPIYEQRLADQTGRYRELASASRLATHDLQTIVRAAHQGRVEVLWVNRKEQRWGRFDAERNRVHVHASARPGDDDLLDRAAVDALLTDALIFAVDSDRLPARQPAAAILRY